MKKKKKDHVQLNIQKKFIVYTIIVIKKLWSLMEDH